MGAIKRLDSGSIVQPRQRRIAAVNNLGPIVQGITPCSEETGQVGKTEEGGRVHTGEDTEAVRLLLACGADAGGPVTGTWPCGNGLQARMRVRLLLVECQQLAGWPSGMRIADRVVRGAQNGNVVSFAGALQREAVCPWYLGERVEAGKSKRYARVVIPVIVVLVAQPETELLLVAAGASEGRGKVIMPQRRLLAVSRHKLAGEGSDG